MELVLYERAKTALAEAHRVDEVKEIRDRAAAAEAYARQARDTQMIQWATEIKVRAERRAGEMLCEMRDRGERAAHGTNRHKKKSHANTSNPPTLAELGVTRMQATRWQALAAMPDEHFETAVETAKNISGAVSSAFVLRQHREGADDLVVASRRARGPRTKAAKERLEALKEAGQQTYTASRLRACIRAIKEFPDEAEAEIELIEELQAVLAEFVERVNARPVQAA